MTSDTVSQCRKIFASFDSDGSGAISREEMQKALENMEMAISDDELQTIIEIVDQNGDGELNLDEFVRFVYIFNNIPNNIAEDRKLATYLFYVADQDYSGTVGTAELLSIFQKLGANVSIEEVQELMNQIVGSNQRELGLEQFNLLIEQIMLQQ